MNNTISNVQGSMSVSTGTCNAIADYETTVCGGLITNLDDQVTEGKNGIEQIVAQKEQISSDKATADGLAKTSVPVNCDAEGNVITHDDGNDDFIASEAVDGYRLDAASTTNLKELCQEYGVSLDGKYHEGGSGCVYFSKETYDQIISSLKDGMDSKTASLNTVSEMKMIQFQAVMDARKQALLMLSNMINSQGQTNLSIIQNMKA